MGLESSPSGTVEANDYGCEVLGDLAEMKPVLGDVVWAKLSDGTWWPIIVVDENNVSEGNKPVCTSKGHVLVRLYGSYKYLYVDYMQCYSELQALKQSNDSHLEFLKNAMEQYILSEISGASKKRRSKSQGASDGRVGGSAGKNVNQNPRRRRMENNGGKSGSKASRQNGVKKKLKFDTPNTDRITRRMKVMQTLGLSAPSGSPFRRNRHAP